MKNQKEIIFVGAILVGSKILFTLLSYVIRSGILDVFITISNELLILYIQYAIIMLRSGILMWFVVRRYSSFLCENLSLFVKKISKQALLTIICLVVMGVGFTFLWGEFPQPYSNFSDKLPHIFTKPWIVLYAFWLLVCAPVTEEIICRKILFFDQGKSAFQKMAWAIASSSIFGLLHTYTLGSIPFIYVGLVYCLFYTFSKNIYTSLFTHMAWNFYVSIPMIVYIFG